MEYSEFLANKSLSNKYSGKIIEPGAVNPVLFDFQRDCVIWACRKGRAALFLDTGLGKTNCQAEWGRLMGGQGVNRCASDGSQADHCRGQAVT